MFVIDGPLDAILIGCFLFGLVFSVVLLLFGDAGLNLDLPGGDADGGDQGGFPINLSTVLAFVAWFGGVGYLALNGAGWSAAVSLAIGAAAGLAGAAIVAWVMTRLVAAQGATLDPEDYRLPGTLARISSSIRAGGVGEIVYEQAGVRQVSAARTADGQALPRGTEVVVLELVNGVALVQSAAAFFEEAGLPSETGAAGDGSRRRALT